MKLRVFQSAEGDCLLLESGGTRVLVDGGMAGSYSKHVAPALGQLRDAGQALDLVYVSHIDQDHISGVLRMLDDLVAWRVFDFQQASGNKKAKKPASVRPPEIKAIWHNAFHEQVQDNEGEIQSLLAASAAVLSGAEQSGFRELALAQQELATSIAEAIQLSRRIGDEQLNIPLNPQFKGRLMMVGTAAPKKFKVGPMRMTILGPFEEDLDELRTEWNAWLKANRKRLDEIRVQAERDREQIGNESGGLIASARAQATELASLAGLEAVLAQSTGTLGERENVTTPNLASLMMHVKEGKRSILLTGDGHWEDILKGLDRAKKLKKGKLHVDVLKVQHHGSEHNIHEDFCRAVTADHYVFCANGSDENPDFRVVELIARERFAVAGKPFQFWFNSHASVAGNPVRAAHMKEVEKRVADLQRENARLSSRFLTESSFDLDLA
jgi:beta-lactamase superfamily II metal-dependent hydrolase